MLFWVICAMTQTAIYSIYRPGFTLRQRLGMWALSPVYPILGLVILRPAAYWALTKLKSTSWHTREVVPRSALSPSIPSVSDGNLGSKGGGQQADLLS